MASAVIGSVLQPAGRIQYDALAQPGLRIQCCCSETPASPEKCHCSPHGAVL